MEKFETEMNGSDYFEEMTQIFCDRSKSDIGIDDNFCTNEIELGTEVISTEYIMESLSEIFVNSAMDEHLATVTLIGDLGHSDVLMYYCVVMDCLSINNEISEDRTKIDIMTPLQFMAERDFVANSEVNVEFVASKSDVRRLERILRYLQNKEFKVLSNTFYMDGSDFILLLNLKSVVGYNLRLKIVFKCDSLNDAIAINEKFQNLRFSDGEADE